MQCCDRFLYYYILAVIPPHQPSPKTHYPSLCTMYLPPLLKGGGLTARHKLSLCCIFACDMPTLFILQTFLPSRRRDCHTIPRSAPPPLPFDERSVGFALSLKKHYILASPRKRGGGTADIIFRLAVQYSDSPAFAIQKQFRAVTVGIVIA